MLDNSLSLAEVRKLEEGATKVCACAALLERVLGTLAARDIGGERLNLRQLIDAYSSRFTHYDALLCAYRIRNEVLARAQVFRSGELRKAAAALDQAVVDLRGCCDEGSCEQFYGTDATSALGKGHEGEPSVEPGPDTPGIADDGGCRSGARPEVEGRWSPGAKTVAAAGVAAVIVLALVGTTMLVSRRDSGNSQAGEPLQQSAEEQFPRGPGQGGDLTGASGSTTIAQIPGGRQEPRRGSSVAASGRGTAREDKAVRPHPAGASKTGPRRGRESKGAGIAAAPFPRRTTSGGTDLSPADFAEWRKKMEADCVLEQRLQGLQTLGAPETERLRRVRGSCETLRLINVPLPQAGPTETPAAPGSGWRRFGQHPPGSAESNEDSGSAQSAQLVSKIQPVYPPPARQARIEGVVHATGTIGVDGRLHNIQIVSGPRIFWAATTAALQQWRYTPAQVNGHAIEADAQIDVNFVLGR
jgi:TonB family protein